LKENEIRSARAVAHIEPKFKKPPERLPVQQPVPEGYLPQSGEAAAEEGSDATSGELFIQVASSKNPDATRRLVDRLRKQGFPAFSAQKEVPGKGVWYRIQLGPFNNQMLAEEALAKMKSQHFEAYLIQQ
jgi:cell division septation protein DedD